MFVCRHNGIIEWLVDLAVHGRPGMSN